jgi:hypothetical protein
MKVDKALYAFRAPKAARLASLGGIEQDLEGVVRYCDILIERSEPPKFKFVEHEAISSAAIIRYGRCFVEGKRDRLSTEVFRAADPELQQFHDYIMALRHRHIAHSVNPFEENAVSIEIASHYQSAAEIEHVYSAHTRRPGLSLNEPNRLKSLAEWLLIQARNEKLLFYDIHTALASPIALEALERIGRLYKIEEDIRGRSAAKRQAVRQARAGPQLESLHAWLHTTVTTLSKKSELAKAIALSNWAALARYRDDGRLEIDNNAAERALRAVALGRKNWLFAGSDDGGERAAAIYTLLGTAKLNDLNPESYLGYVLERIADLPVNQIDELLPWNLLQKMPELRIAA